MVTDYGYGTLIVGLPLWFATPPQNPQRAENVLDDFVTRTTAALEWCIKPILDSPKCPFGKVWVVWEPSFEVLDQWRSAADMKAADDPRNLRLSNPFNIKLALQMVDAIGRFVGKEREQIPSFLLSVGVNVYWKQGKFEKVPEILEIMHQAMTDSIENSQNRHIATIKRRLLHLVLELSCFAKLHGRRGLSWWIMGKFGIGRLTAALNERRAKRLYIESVARRRS